MGANEATIVEPEPEVEDTGAPVEQGAEATRTNDHLFQYSQYVHAGAGAATCEHAEDGKCDNEEHFHAWVHLPNSLQHKDIQEKGRAAQARRRRAMRDAGDATRPPSDSYSILEAELDDLMLGDREAVLNQVADRRQRESFGAMVLDIREHDPRFEHYAQDAEEYRRLVELPEEDRPEEEFKRLDEAMTEFGKAIEERVEGDKERELANLRDLSEDAIRDILREARIEGESNAEFTQTYYMWMGFIGTRKVGDYLEKMKRYWKTLEDFRNASPEAVDAIDLTLRDLEGRLTRGDAAGN